MISKSDKNKYYKQLAVSYRNTARMNKCRAAVHLESDYDKRFWASVLKHYFPGYSFEYITYSKTADRNRATGCSACLRYFYLGCLSDEFFICIDSDYRRLLQHDSADTAQYVFQTYTYSIENHYCYSKNIGSVFNKMGLPDSWFDFKGFFEEFSRTIYTLFIYHIISLSEDDGLFGLSEFNTFVKADITKSTPDEKAIIADLQIQVGRKLGELRGNYTYEQIESTKKRCRKLGLHEDNTYLYLRGHNVFDRVVLPLVKKLREQQERIVTQDYSGREKQDYYARELKSVEDYLTEDLCFGEYDEIINIENDIKRYKRNN